MYQLTDEQYMARCLQLAASGSRDVAPNPMVGAVIVANGHIVGEGFHRCYGDLHAEPNAIASVADPDLTRGSTLYVNLEPCSHYGKTSPCADLIIERGIRRVVIGQEDPNPQVAGKGIEKLRSAGIEVTVGVLENDCRELNKRFNCYHEQHRPYVLLKWAQTADGFIDHMRTNVSQPVAVISNRITKQLVHQMRAENMAIMVGTHTALLDDPSLCTTRWEGKNPLRVVIDRRLFLPKSSRLLQPLAPTLVFSEQTNYPFMTEAEVQVIDFSCDTWPQILDELYHRKVHSVLVEGGRILIDNIVQTGIWDEAHIETAPGRLDRGVEAPHLLYEPYREEMYDGHIVRYYRKRCNP